MTAVIVANGQYPRREYPLYLISSADFIVCCDGALSALEKHGVTPDVVIGDMDSVCTRALGRFRGIVVKDPDQETNDLTKAFNYIVDNCPDVDTLHILGATGRSEAHTVGNMSLLMDYCNRCPQMSIDIVSDYSTMLAITDSDSIYVGQGRKISVFTPDPTLRIRSKGLKWPLDNVVFDNWWKAALNEATDDEVELILNHKSMVLIVLD